MRSNRNPEALPESLRSRLKPKPAFRSFRHGVWLALLLTTITAPAAHAQTCAGAGPVTVIPVAPDSQRPVTLQFLGFEESCSTLAYRIDGNLITVENVWNCAIGILTVPRAVNIGALPPGSYAVRVYDAPEAAGERPPRACGSFTVAAVTLETIPALSSSAIIVLALLLSAVGVVVVQRMT